MVDTISIKSGPSYPATIDGLRRMHDGHVAGDAVLEPKSSVSVQKTISRPKSPAPRLERGQNSIFPTAIKQFTPEVPSQAELALKTLQGEGSELEALDFLVDVNIRAPASDREPEIRSQLKNLTKGSGVKPLIGHLGLAQLDAERSKTEKDPEKVRKLESRAIKNLNTVRNLPAAISQQHISDFAQEAVRLIDDPRITIEYMVPNAMHLANLQNFNNFVGSIPDQSKRPQLEKLRDDLVKNWNASFPIGVKARSAAASSTIDIDRFSSPSTVAPMLNMGFNSEHQGMKQKAINYLMENRIKHDEIIASNGIKKPEDPRIGLFSDENILGELKGMAPLKGKQYPENANMVLSIMHDEIAKRSASQV